jgi:hypothetical protein
MEQGDFSFLKEGAASFSKSTADSLEYEVGRIDKKIEKLYPVYDSGLINGPSSFNERFKKLVPEGYADMKEYIEAILKEKSGIAVGVEIGGPGSQLFSEFTNHFFQETIGCTLTDDRAIDTKKSDTERNHFVVEGNAFSSEGYRDLKEKLNGKKVNVFLERMQGGLPAYTYSNYLTALFDRYYNLLDNHAVLFIQLPHIVFSDDEKTSMDTLLTKLKSVPGFDVAWDDITSLVRIEKKSDAPEDLASYFA